jgi:hypothetical protein
MRQKYKCTILLLILLMPLIHLFDNQILANSSEPLLANEAPEITPLASIFDVKVHIGDPFSDPYSSFEFNPNDEILITGAVKNSGSSGYTITVSLWLVGSASPYPRMLHLQNLTGIIPAKSTRSFTTLNAGDVLWNVSNTVAGTYRVLAEVIRSNVKQTSAVSGKCIVVRQLRIADFEVTKIASPNLFYMTKEISLPNVGTSFGLTYYNSHLYMTNYNNNSILKIDPVTGTIVSTISISGYSGKPYGITTDGKSGFYIAYRNNNEYVRVSFSGVFNFKVTSPLSNPMALTMLGSYLGITGDSSNKIYKVAPFTGQVLENWTVLGNYLYGLTVGHGEIWYTDSQNDVIRGINYTTHVQKYVLNTGDWRGLAFDGTYLWAWNYAAKKLVQFHPVPLKYQYQITNVGNCNITGSLSLQVQKLVGTTWENFGNPLNSTHPVGASVNLVRGQSLLGEAILGMPSGVNGVYRLYTGIVDALGQPLCNLNNSVPMTYQGGLYLDSDKVPRLQIIREIQEPNASKYFQKQELNVTIWLQVVGRPPSQIGIFGLGTEVPLSGIKNIHLVDQINELVIPDPKGFWYAIDNGPKDDMPAVDYSKNTCTFNATYFADSRFSAMALGQKMRIRYNIEANFTPEIKRSFQLPGENKKSVSFRETIITPIATQFDTLEPATKYQLAGPIIGIDPDLLVAKIGVVFYAGRMLDLYDAIDVLGLLIKLILWANDLPDPYEAVIYTVDEDLSLQLDFMGLTNAQKTTYNGLDMSDRAHWLFGHIDHNLIAQAIEECVTNEADVNEWDYLMLIGGYEVIPQRILPSPRQTTNPDYALAEVATDFFYGDLTPEANLAVDGYMPEVVVSRLPGRTPQDIATLLDAGDIQNPTSGHVGLISYYKGEDSMRRLESVWPAVKGTLYQSLGQYTDNLVERFMNPGSVDYGNNPANFDYAFILFSDHAGVNGYGDGGTVWISQADLAGFDDYVNQHRPFYYIRACRAGWIGDPGNFKLGNTYAPGTSICLDMLAKGVAGILGSTRNSQSPDIEDTIIGLADSAVRPNGAPVAVDGTYRTGTVNFEGTVVDVFLADTVTANVMSRGGIDLDNDNLFEAGEMWDDGDYFVSPTGFTVYQFNFNFGNVRLTHNEQEDWNDIYAQYFTGEQGTGLMDGVNVGTAFYNGKRNYWAYMQSGVHAAGSDDEACDFQQLYEFNLYGVPIYRPILTDPPSGNNYTVQFTTVTDWGFNATFGIENYVNTSLGPYDLFQIQGASLTSGAGVPRLPIIMENVTLPEDFEVTDIQIAASISTQLPGFYNISCGMPPEEDGLQSGNSAQIHICANYPGKLFDYTTMKDKDGSTLLYLYFYPFQWDSQTGIVTYYSNITLHVDCEEQLDPSVSLAVTKTPASNSLSFGTGTGIQIEMTNCGSNTIFNIVLQEYFSGDYQDSALISALSTSGYNDSCLIGLHINTPLVFFSGWYTAESRISYQDASGLTYSMTVSSNIYIDSWFGIFVIIVCLIGAIAITVVILKNR